MPIGTTNRFIGKDGFIWWVGVIENRKDSLGLGRCQVRIFGWHSENKMTLPTEGLPWAQPLYPINNSKAFSAPRIGDWVVGFFMDGLAAQAPVMLGVLPGIVQPEEPTQTETTESNPYQSTSN